MIHNTPSKGVLTLALYNNKAVNLTLYFVLHFVSN